jgi:hypothetical protein
MRHFGELTDLFLLVGFWIDCGRLRAKGTILNKQKVPFSISISLRSSGHAIYRPSNEAWQQALSWAAVTVFRFEAAHPQDCAALNSNHSRDGIVVAGSIA